MLRKNGNYELAIHVVMQALKFANNEKEQALCSENLGLLYWNTGSLKDSIHYYQQALFLAQKNGFKRIINRCQDAIGIYFLYVEGKDFRDLNEYQKSEESFEKAICMARKLGSKEHEVKCIRQLSLTYEDANNLNEFLYLNQEALRIAQSVNLKSENGKCLINIGNYYRKVANYSEALIYYGKALKVARSLKSKKDESVCLNNIGIVYQDLGDFDRAFENLKYALEIDQYLKDSLNISMDLNNIGTTFRAKGIVSKCQGDLYKSLFYFNKCLKLSMNPVFMKDREKKFKIIEVQALNNIGTVLNDLKNLDGAQEFLLLGYKKALEIKDFEVIGMSLVNLGFVYLNQGNYKESINSFKNAIKLGKDISNSQILWEAYFGLGQCYEKNQIYYLSVNYYKKAIDIIDLIRSQILLDSYKVGFARNKLKVYESIINLLYKLSIENPSVEIEKEIFHMAERAKARAFLDNLAQSRIDLRKNSDPKLKNSENEISNKISFIRQKLLNSVLSERKRKELLLELQRVELKYMSLILKKELNVSEMRNLVSYKPCNVEQIQGQLLNENTALIEYFLGENQSIMFLITKNEFSVFSLPSRIEIENSLRAFLKALSDPPKGKFEETSAAMRIYNELIFPAEKRIEGSISNLIIIPDGILYYLPFEVLVKGINDKPSEIHYLIKEYGISYAPSSTILMFLERIHYESNRVKDLLAFGSPNYSSTALTKRNKKNIYINVLNELLLNMGFVISPLPYSKKEILIISKYFPPEKRQLFLKKNAKEEVIKKIPLINFKIIHFACHALLDEEFPFRSALILSFDEDGKEDGFLQVREIYNLKLNAELVILSACQTGKGKLEKREGILGFPRIFFYIGAKSVILSLWKINDKSTSIFMDYFYYYLSQGDEKANALRLAKLKMMESKFSHPFYWATFVLNGDYNSQVGFE